MNLQKGFRNSSRICFSGTSEKQLKSQELGTDGNAPMQMCILVVTLILKQNCNTYNCKLVAAQLTSFYPQHKKLNLEQLNIN